MNFKDYTINELRHLLADNDIDFARTDDKADLIRLADEAFGSDKIKNTAYIEKATARLKKEGKYVETSSTTNSNEKATTTAKKTSVSASATKDTDASASVSKERSGSGTPKWLWPLVGIAVAALAAWALLFPTGILGGNNNVVKDSSGKIIGLDANVSGPLKNLLGDSSSAIIDIPSNAVDIDAAKSNASGLLSAVNNLPENIKNENGVKKAIDKLNDAVKSGNVDDINVAITDLQGAVANAAKSAKNDAAKAIEGIDVKAEKFEDAKKNGEEAIKQFNLLPEGIKNQPAVSDAQVELDAANNSGDANRVNEALKNFKKAVKDATDEGQQAIAMIAGIPNDAQTIEEIKSNADFAQQEFKNLPEKVKNDKEVEKTQKALNEAADSDDKDKINQAIADFQNAVANAAAKDADNQAETNPAEKTEGVLSQEGRQDGIYFDGPFMGQTAPNFDAINYAGQHVTILARQEGYQGSIYAQVRTDAGQIFWIDQAAIQ